MNKLLRKILKKFRKPGLSLLQSVTEAQYKILSLMSPAERDRIAQQHIEILSGQQGNRKINLLWSHARALNDELSADVRSISDDEWSKFGEQVRSFCQARNFSPEYTQEILSHKYRYYLTIKWLQSILNPDDDKVVLEMGGEGVSTDILRRYFPRIKWQHTEGDLRYPWNSVVDESLDLIVSMEVLEHLTDLPDRINHGFFKTGLIAAIKESYRVLKPGGVFFITTPNGGSIIHLEQTLAGASPWFYQFHNREYTIYELQDGLKQAGFTIDRWKAVHGLTIDNHWDHTRVFQMLLDYSYEKGNRGDDLFIVASKVPNSLT